MVAVSVVVSDVDARETHIDADGAPIVDLCAALCVCRSDAAIHEETSESVVVGVKASYSRRAEHVCCPDSFTYACLSPSDCDGIRATLEDVTNVCPVVVLVLVVLLVELGGEFTEVLTTLGIVVDSNDVKAMAAGALDCFGEVVVTPLVSVDVGANTDTTA